MGRPLEIVEADGRTRLGLRLFVFLLAGTLLALSIWSDRTARGRDFVEVGHLSRREGPAALKSGAAPRAAAKSGVARPNSGLVARCHGSRAPAREILEVLSQDAPRLRYERRALVGSSPVLRGQGRGFEIDRHDTVIRVNRVPQQKFYQDYGQRTDILFVAPGWAGHEIFSTKGIHVEVMGEVSFKEAKLCSFTGGPACRFATLVLSHLHSGFPLDKPGWRPRSSAFPMACTRKNVSQVADGFSGFHTGKRLPGGPKPRPPWPTNGFYSLVTFAPLCTTLQLFGFGGTDTIDGHGIDHRIHNISNDHYLLNRIIDGKLKPSDWAGLDLKEFREERVQWMGKYLAERGRRGCIFRAKD